MQIISNGDNLHEMSNPDLWENKEHIISMLSAKYSQRVVKVKQNDAALDRLLIKK